MMFGGDTAVGLPLKRLWQASSESSTDRRHREGVLFCNAHEGIPKVYHVGIYLAIETGLERPRRRLNRRSGRFSRMPSVLIL
jgi:hypothetical protein